MCPEQFDGDWPFVANPDMRGSEKIRTLIKMRAAMARIKRRAARAKKLK